MSLRLVLHHCRAQILQHLRAPGYMVPALVYPPLFFVFFGVPEVRDDAQANLIFASYAAYAFMGVAFNQFAGGVAEDRRRAWDTYLRTLPAHFGHRMAGWALSGLIFGLLALLTLTIVAVLTIDVGAPLLHWLFLAVALVFGSVTIALLATTCGYLMPPVAAYPVATLIYFSLTYAGGLWTSPESLPGWLQQISPFLPTRLWGEISWASVQGHAWQTLDWVGLAGYTVVFGVLAVWGYRRQGER